MYVMWPSWLSQPRHRPVCLSVSVDRHSEYWLAMVTAATREDMVSSASQLAMLVCLQVTVLSVNQV